MGASLGLGFRKAEGDVDESVSKKKTTWDRPDVVRVKPMLCTASKNFKEGWTVVRLSMTSNLHTGYTQLQPLLRPRFVDLAWFLVCLVSLATPYGSRLGVASETANHAVSVEYRLDPLQ